MSYGLIVVEGLAVGVLTGLVGVGGGFLIVPALVVLGKVPMKEAVGTSLLVIAMKSAAGFVGYFGQVQISWGYLGLFTAVAIAGSLGGTYLVRYVPQGGAQEGLRGLLGGDGSVHPLPEPGSNSLRVGARQSTAPTSDLQRRRRESEICK